MNIEIVAPEGNQNKTNRSGVFGRIAMILTVSLLSVQFAGCSIIPPPDLFDGTIIDTAFGRYRDKVWAKRACNLRYSNCDRPYASHFQTGFEAGYQDICEGGDGYVPATPPEKYWGFDFQTPDGAKCVNAWFEGYPAGVAAAKRDRAGTYRDVYVSRMIQSALVQENGKRQAPPTVSVNQSKGATASGKNLVGLNEIKTTKNDNQDSNIVVPGSKKAEASSSSGYLRR